MKKWKAVQNGTMKKNSDENSAKFHRSLFLLTFYLLYLFCPFFVFLILVRIEPDRQEGVRAQLKRMKELCKERNSLYEKQKDLKGQKQKTEKPLERQETVLIFKW